jgi:hypothetical protein
MEVSGQLHALVALPSERERPWYPLKRRLGESQSWCTHESEEKNLFTCRESNPGHPAHSLVIILTDVSQLIHKTYNNKMYFLPFA